MTNPKHVQFLRGSVASIVVVLFFVIFAEWDPGLLKETCREDGAVENTTALLFGLSGICFVIFAVRSEFLRKKESGPRYLLAVCWIMLMVFLMGEEVSWGQRILNFPTPEKMSEVNVQGETNLHNIAVVSTFMGGTYRYLSILLLGTGLVLPLLAETRFGRHVIHLLALPVAPLCYAVLFVGAFLYGRYYFPLIDNPAAEVRELLLSLGMFAFALHGAISPDALFRTHPQ
jgi:hypothetical protein